MDSHSGTQALVLCISVYMCGCVCGVCLCRRGCVWCVCCVFVYRYGYVGTVRGSVCVVCGVCVIMCVYMCHRVQILELVFMCACGPETIPY